MDAIVEYAERPGEPNTSQLRWAVRQLLSAAADGTPPSPRALDVVNAAPLLARSPPQLNWPAGGRPTLWEAREVQPADAAGADIAASLIALLTGPDADRVRRCPAARCGRIFAAADPRQRWCSPGCGNRTRVARHSAR